MMTRLHPKLILLILPIIVDMLLNTVVQNCSAAPRGLRDKTLTLQSAQTLAALVNLTFRDTLAASRWNTPNTANTLEFRPMFPLILWNQMNLMRLVVPYRTKFDRGAGLGDTRIFDLISFKEKWGFWGVGPVVNFRVRIRPTDDTFQAGPVAAFVVSRSGWAFGLLNQNLFSDHIAASTVQPILVYQFHKNWTVGLGELPFVYNWKDGLFTFVPIGFQVGFVAEIAGQAIRLFLNPQFNTKIKTGAPQWTVASGVTFLVLP